MRVLSLVGLIAVATLTAADSTKSGVAVQSDAKLLSRVLVADHKQVKRSLRYTPDELDSKDSEDEERGVGADKIDDIVTKLDDVTGLNKLDDAAEKAKRVSPKLDAAIKKNMDELEEFGRLSLAKKLQANHADAPTLRLPVLKQMNAIEKSTDRVSLVASLKGKYPEADDLSLSALQQLGVIEARRPDDIKKFKLNKDTGDGMHKPIPDFEGIKKVPKQFLESHVGRGTQRYGANKERLLSAAVVSRPANQGGGDVLLISSSKPTKGDWLLPKGGWDHGEDVKRAALREVVEEGGVKAQLLHGLGKSSFEEGGKGHTYYAYMMKSSTVYDDWAESARYRIWVSYDDAIKMLSKKRPQFAKMVEEAKKKAAKIAAGKLPEQDKKMRKFTLAGLE
ncbi:hypothetical protein PHMEG_00028684 [Phytophthora megakarya]|uniref:Nudix hydrolase domain-containing protein n=1 Tax=Phytophthora megakarya TaxID=4795 RepID=A0A225V2K7_9STRA|nr:hypothetical protein PHMEG_00028684 [Phytophthora megakarya]